MSKPILIPESTTIRVIASHVYETAASKGFHDGPPRDIATIAALLHSEVSELYEEHRNGREPGEVYYENNLTLARFERRLYPTGQKGIDLAAAGVKPEGIPVELADVVIRAFDVAVEYGLDLDYLIRLKDAYNQTRERKHGKIA